MERVILTLCLSAKSGFKVSGDAKALVRITTNNEMLYVASQNRDSLRVFEMERRLDQAVWLSPLPTDVSAELIFADGKKQKVEFYYGSGFLSQSSRKIRIPKAVREIVIYDYVGNSRKITPEGI